MPLLELKNIYKNYEIESGMFAVSQVRANIDVNLKLNAGRTLAIVGESGSGKSTLAKQIIGIEEPSSGEIYLHNKKLDFSDKKDRTTRFQEIRMIFQDPYASINPQLRIGDTLNHTLKINTQLSSSERKKKIEDTLMLVGLQKSHQYHYANSFSGGQRQRIAIARAIILEPSIIIADEPLSALDVSVQAQIINLLLSIQEKLGISIIFISHDLNVVEHIADDVIVMYQGSIVEEGKVAQIFDEPLHPYTQALFASTPTYKQ
ncbi:MAG: ATP-binding cassette domain-containing protein, partial [Kangiellaceae bacterium]